jgi:hypothetical protein
LFLKLFLSAFALAKYTLELTKCPPPQKKKSPVLKGGIFFRFCFFCDSLNFYTKDAKEKLYMSRNPGNCPIEEENKIIVQNWMNELKCNGKIFKN